jgi:TonB family protein
MSRHIFSCFMAIVFVSTLSMPTLAQAVKNSSEPNFDSYLQRMKVMIKRHWHPPSDTHKTRAVVDFTIGTSGQLSNLRVSSSSGDPLKDAAAMEAVKQTVPFEMLPKGSPQEVRVSFSFDFDPKYKSGEPEKSLQIVNFKGSKAEAVDMSKAHESK